jgi:hypothetical protein
MFQATPGLTHASARVPKVNDETAR